MKIIYNFCIHFIHVNLHPKRMTTSTPITQFLNERVLDQVIHTTSNFANCNLVSIDTLIMKEKHNVRTYDRLTELAITSRRKSIQFLLVRK